MVVAYKYFKKKFLENHEKGIFHVNTFSNIRESSENGAIYDKHEACSANETGEILIADPTHPESQIHIQDLGRLGIMRIGKNCSNITIDNCTSYNTLPDAFMYCVSSERNDAYWQSISEEQGGPYDCYIEILDFSALVRKLRDALAKQNKLKLNCISRKCFYATNKGVVADHNTQYPDYFRKPNEEQYRSQSEVRAVFVPHEKTPEPLNPVLVHIDASKIIRCVSI